ncbi:hypothetical protein AS593_06925 [Caulobacter vibrioides]|nr:hypothetical protein AS593_06925 [Caulobacter vibrioides]
MTGLHHARPPNDAASLDGLYRRYARWLAAMVRLRFKAVDRQGAEDLVHEVYMRVAPVHARGEVRHPKALLLKVASNLARNQLRRNARGGAAIAMIEEIDEKAEHAVAPEQEETLLLGELIASLPANLREVFVLSRFAGMTNQQIAVQLDLSVKRVEARMTLALAHLAQTLNLQDDRR